MRLFSLFFLFFSLAFAALANVSLPVLFTDHMVLQRGRPVPVWGWADAGEAVKVTFAGQTKTVKADANGRWKISLETLQASDQPQELTVAGNNTVVVKDVVVGEVWLCSGQSNMAMSVSGVVDAAKEKEAAGFPLIRMFFVQSFTATDPQEQCKGVWQASSPQTIANFSATAYFFGRDLHKALNVPVGLINSSVGGTAIEAWTSMDAMKDKTELKPLLEQWKQDVALFEKPENKSKYEADRNQWQEDVKKAAAAKQPSPRQPAFAGRDPLNANRPANLFNGKIAPLVPYAIRGAIWYQGESNAANGPLYATQLPLMIGDWRTRWGYEFPFAWVQLPNFMKREATPLAPSTWARLREAQTRALSVPNTGMSINLEIGEEGNIHPKNKQEIGRRLALWALAKVYDQNIPYSGPLYEGHQIKDGEVIIRFKPTGGGLKTSDGSTELKGFAIADERQNWRWGKARIEGDQVIVSHPDIKTPSAVRYAWANNPEVNLINGAGLPACPFRTDDWPMDNNSMPVPPVAK